MQVRVSKRIEARQQDQTRRADDRSETAYNTKDLLELASIVRQPSSVSQPSFGDEGNVKDNHGDGATSDEERFQTLRADV